MNVLVSRIMSFAAISACCLLGVAAHAAGDLSGAWVITAPVRSLQTLDGKMPPLTAAMRQQYQQYLAAAKRGDRSWDPVAKCKPPGEPRTLMESSWPFEIMQSTGRIDFLFQWNRLARSIYLLNEQPEFQGPYYFGQSIARWDGDTLVVQAIGFKDSTFLDASGLPHSDELQLTERFRVIDGGKTLEARIRFEDAKAFSQPWETRLTFKRLPAGTRIQEDSCLDRLKSDDYATLNNALVK